MSTELDKAEEYYTDLVQRTYHVSHDCWLDALYATEDLEDVELLTEKIVSTFDGRGWVWTKLFVASVQVMDSYAREYPPFEEEDAYGYVHWHGNSNAFEMWFESWSSEHRVELDEALKRAHPS